MIILSLIEKDAAVVNRLLISPPDGADAVEVRLDAMKHREPSRWFPGSAVAKRPVLASCRSRKDGGLFAGSEKSRGEALLSAARAGVAYVDIEFESACMKMLPDLAHAQIMLSHHDRRRTPRASELFARYRKMAAIPGVAVVKIVTTATDPADILEIRQLLDRAASGKVPLLALAMGEPGVPSRILAKSWGSWGTYVSLRKGAETAPGQITLEEATDLYRVAEIDEETRLAGITGHPIAHSLSPVIHNAAYHHQRINFRYLPFPSPSVDRLPDLMRKLGIRGLSVTSPHKIAFARKIRQLDPFAARAGAVNTVLRAGGKLMGFNTDAEGLLHPLRARIDPAGKIAVVLGSGGAARAVALALHDAGASVLVCSRRERQGIEVARLASGRYVAPRRLAKEAYDILVNATPVGMDGRSMPVSSAALKGSLIADLIYHPVRTPLLAAALARGISTLGGLDILLAQAIEQYPLLTGRSAPVEVMRDALLAASREPVGAEA